MSDHGCWFCHKPVDDDGCFSFEWDCEMHFTCLVAQKRAGNAEAEIVYQEIGLAVQDADEFYEDGSELQSNDEDYPR